MLLHLELLQCRWAENLIMVEKIAHPTLSSSTLMISVEYLLLLGYKIFSSKCQEEKWISKDLPSDVVNHVIPTHPIYYE